MNSKRLQEAFTYASDLHANQKRKGTDIPYLSHLMGVASIVMVQEGTEDETIAALLHDAVEDQGGLPTLEEIRKRFGDEVARIVEGCTDADTIPKPEWRERKEKYLAHLREAGPSVRLVSAADKLYNVRSIVEDYRVVGEELWSRFRGGKDGTLWYYRTLAETYQKIGPPELADKIGRVVSELEELVRERDAVKGELTDS